MILVGHLELDQDLHLGEGETALVDHPEDLSALGTHAAEDQRPQLDGEIVLDLLLVSDRCFH